MDFLKKEKEWKSNGIFLDGSYYSLFKENLENKNIKNLQGVAFSFAYYYLSSYVWKYSKYNEQLFEKKDFLNVILKRERYSSFDYLIKKDGVLEKLKILETTNNFPISNEFDKDQKQMNYLYINDIEKELKKEIMKNTFKKYSVKKPIRFYKIGDEPGYNYNQSDSIFINLKEFLTCINDKDISYLGFYFYCYIKFNIVKFGGYQNGILKTTYPIIKKETGFNERMITKLFKHLKEKGLLEKEVKLENVKGENKTITYFSLGKESFKI